MRKIAVSFLLLGLFVSTPSSKAANALGTVAGAPRLEAHQSPTEAKVVASAISAENPNLGSELIERFPLGSRSVRLREKFGRPLISLRDKFGNYAAYSVANDRAWFVVYEIDGVIRSTQVSLRAHEDVSLVDPYGIRLGDDAQRVESVMGKGQAGPGWTRSRLYGASGSGRWFYGFTPGGKVQRFGRASGVPILPAYVEWYQENGPAPATHMASQSRTRRASRTTRQEDC
jgi:hypothetical protein